MIPQPCTTWSRRMMAKRAHHVDDPAPDFDDPGVAEDHEYQLEGILIQLCICVSTMFAAKSPAVLPPSARFRRMLVENEFPFGGCW